MAISDSKLQDFFKYFDAGNENHLRSIELLHEDLAISAPRLLEDESQWITKYREKPPEPETTNPLSVPYDCQLNHGSEGWRLCFTASCAMTAKFWLPDLDINEYYAVRPRFGDSTEAHAQVRTLQHFGLNAVFKQMGSKEKLKKQIDRGRCAPVAFLHHGSPQYPTGGGHYVVCIGYSDEEQCFIFNDPYGECSVAASDGGYPNPGPYGQGVKYSYKNWVPRWSVANSDDGWGLDVWK